LVADPLEPGIPAAGAKLGLAPAPTPELVCGFEAEDPAAGAPLRHVIELGELGEVHVPSPVGPVRVVCSHRLNSAAGMRIGP
jgi:hypothetical protein